MVTSQALDFAFPIGGSGSPEDAKAVTTDASGNIYVAGRFTGTTDFNPLGSPVTQTSNGWDSYVVKYDPSGQLLWLRVIGGGSGSDASNIHITSSGELYLTGLYQNGSLIFDPGGVNITIAGNNGSYDSYLIKLDLNGNYQWSVHLGSSGYDNFSGIDVSPSGNPVLYGQFGASLVIDPNNSGFGINPQACSDAAVVEFSAVSGEMQSYLHFSGAGCIGANEGFAIDQASGDYFLSGYFDNTMDLDPMATNNIQTSAGGNDFFIGRYSPAGAVAWAYTMGGTNDEYDSDLVLDNNGDVYALMYFQGNFDADPSAANFTLTSNGNWDTGLLKYGATGSFEWAQGIGGGSGDVGQNLYCSPNNEIYFTGGFRNVMDMDPSYYIDENGYPNNNSQTFVVCYEPSGNYKWSNNLGTTGNDVGYGIHVNALDEVFIVGNFNGSGDFDPGDGTFNLTSNSSTNDGYLVKLVPCGNADYVPITAVGGSTICEGDSVELTIPNFSLNDNTTWAWYNDVPGGTVEGTGLSEYVSPIVGTTYYVRGKGDCSWHGPVDSIFIDVIPSPTVTASTSTDTVCPGTPITLTGSGATSYSWDNGTTNGVSFNAPSVTTTYQLLGTDANGCSGTDSVQIVIVPFPVIDVVNSTFTDATCYPLTDGEVDISANGNGWALEYSIDGGNSFQTSTMFNALTPGSYQIFAATVMSGCKDTLDFVISTADTLIASLAGLEPSCSYLDDGQIQYDLSGGDGNYNVSLFDIAGLPGSSLGGSITGTWVNLTAGQYLHVFEDGNGCRSGVDTIVLVAPAPLTYDVNVQDLCLPNLGSINLSNISGGEAGYVFAINGGAFQMDSSFNDLLGGSYEVVVSDANSCSDTANYTVQDLTPQQAVISVNNPYCDGLGVLSASGIGTIGWFDQNYNLLNSGNTISLPNAIGDGDYIIAVNIVSGCSSLPDSALIQIEYGDLEILPTIPFAVCPGEVFDIEAIGSGNINWVPNGYIQNPTSTATQARPEESIYFTAVMNLNSCFYSDSVYVEVYSEDQCVENTVNAFSPNGDGLNDSWYVDLADDYPNNKLIVFNRWGDIVTSISNYNNMDNSWDGTYDDGSMVPSGTYFYVFEITTEERKVNGWIQVTD